MASLSGTASLTRQASLSFATSQSLLKLMSTESAMPSHHLILCLPLLLLPSILPNIRGFSSEIPCIILKWGILLFLSEQYKELEENNRIPSLKDSNEYSFQSTQTHPRTFNHCLIFHPSFLITSILLVAVPSLTYNIFSSENTKCKMWKMKNIRRYVLFCPFSTTVPSAAPSLDSRAPDLVGDRVLFPS